MGALTCEPIRVPQSIIEGCLAAKPALRRTYGTLAADWLRRNEVAAATLEAQCHDAIPRQTSDPQEVERFWMDVRRMNDETIRERLSEYAASSSGCDDALMKIQNGKGDLDWFLLKK
ncbi:MAG: hypothetical protein EOP35_09170 [Rubrivivax sp.]|nr:MAG: hypothetical protein EOP35_09170 [Rubrivivax sp.]